MRLEDRDGYEQDRLDREDAAERTRVQREAARAFHQLASRPTLRHRQTSERRAQVVLAAAAIAALGTDGYAHVYAIGGGR